MWFYKSNEILVIKSNKEGGRLWWHLEVKGYICDMDGVIYHGNRLLDGVIPFVNWLKEEKKDFLFLTNSSERSPKELMQKLSRLGIEADETHFYTSALATAMFYKVNVRVEVHML